MTFISVGAMYLHARTFCTLTDTTFIPMGALYLHARTFCTLGNMTFIPAGTRRIPAGMICMPVGTISNQICTHGRYLAVYIFMTELLTCKNKFVL